MHIKQITIEGFKTYNNTTKLENLSEGLNVIVGKNGSGKSNFFAAIRFVLSDAYANATREERQNLLHEGAGAAAVNAYVEIIFDNTDNRFLTGKDELILRRTIGLKKDEYSIDKKSATKADVTSLLESAGFSKSNPYYIVPQGRVASLTNAHDEERLRVLKEVAGTQVYEDKRAESVKIMEETELKRQKIEEHLEQLTARLAELEAEKKELQAYQEHDKERRTLEHVIYDREYNEINEKLKEIEEDRQNELMNAENQTTELGQIDAEIADKETEIALLKNRIESLQNEKIQINDDRQDNVKEKAKLDLEVKDLQERVDRSGEEESTLDKELKSLEKDLASKKKELDKLLPDFQQASAQVNNLNDRLNSVSEKREALYSKQRMSSRYKSKEERDRYLKSEIQSIKTQIADYVTQIREKNAEAKKLTDEANGYAKDIAQIRANNKTRSDSIDEMKQKYNANKDFKEKLVKDRKELWTRESTLQKEMSNFKTEQSQFENTLNSTVSKEISGGIQAIQAYVERTKIPGVYGPLYQLFEVEDNYALAVDTIAGSSLFHVVVDTDDTAVRLLEFLNKEKAGRVTFMPLNRLRVSPVQDPKSKDVVPMLKKLKYKPEVEKAFMQAFGKVLICRDLKLASEFSKQGYHCVTLEGDQVNKKGALTGGYVEKSKSRLFTIKEMKKSQEKIAQMEKELQELGNQIEKISQQVTTLDGEMQKITADRQQASDAQEFAEQDLSTKIKKEQHTRTLIEKRQKDISINEANQKSLEHQVDLLTQELNSPSFGGLSPQETESLNQYTKEVDELKEELKQATNHKTELQSRKNQLEIEVNESLAARKQEMTARLQRIRQGDFADQLESDKKRQKVLADEIAMQNARVTEIEKELDTRTTELRKKTTEQETLKTQRDNQLKRIQDQLKQKEKVLSKRALYLQKQEEVTKKIRELGHAPTGMEKYKNTSNKELLRLLHTANEELKKYGHVNKKAYEQFRSFDENRVNLIKRKEDLDRSAEAIQELIETLDLQKDEAIERTFKQVAKEFEEVFKRLVPNGRGQLSMKKRPTTSGDQASGSQSQSRTARRRVDQYTGVAFRVSFTNQQEMTEQLSGGQKTIVALALIFAIQRCDPAPFYLFDEIDANLDPVYRTAVAEMIEETSRHAQFISTTFRPELLAHADNCYGVSFANKVSNIRPISKEAALDFVDDRS